jgi:hypothetical protein
LSCSFKIQCGLAELCCCSGDHQSYPEKAQSNARQGFNATFVILLLKLLLQPPSPQQIAHVLKSVSFQSIMVEGSETLGVGFMAKFEEDFFQVSDLRGILNI